MENRFGKEITILPSLCDSAALLGIPDTFGLFMDVASEHAAALGCGIRELGEKGLFAEGAGIRLVGAGVTDIDDGSYRQMSLLDWDPGEDQAENDVIQQAGKGIPGKPDGAEKEDPETNLQAKTDSAAAGSGEKTDSGLTGPEEKADSVPAGPGDKRDNPSDRAARLREMEARINRRYGDGTVRRGAGSEFSE